MFETIVFLAAPLTICLLLVGVLGYFGNHILTRGIIFVDIALAQIASLGAMLGILMGLSAESTATSIFSLVFTLSIISIPSLIKDKDINIPQEAIIGILYGLSLAIGIILADKIPGGSNFIKKTLTGSILWVTWEDVLVSLLLFAVIGGIHYKYFEKFTTLSEQYSDGIIGESLKYFELVFFVTFGIVVVKSVEIGGIFVVFAFLIAPAAIAILFTDDWKKRIAISWLSGFVGAALGIILSYRYNLPNGPTIVCTLGLILVLVGAFKKMFGVKLSN